ncbi:MAG TPA: DNA-binding transcriptional regulator Fis [Gammaproteobacteria bacterium]|nr:DNA-binding transcriptional regulator Fis [Gammaproteobacteria bacterium]
MLNPEKAVGLHMEPPKNPPEPLRTCVQKALDKYFADLNGHAPGDLYQMVMREVEAPLLESVMAYTRGNQTRAAEILGINRSTLRKRLRTHNLDK